jgi:hypothetical protein
MATKSWSYNSGRRSAGLLLRLCCVGVVIATAGAQTPCCVRELYKPEGWNIPGLAGAVTRSQSTEQDGRILVETMKPGAPAASIMVVACASDTPGRLEIHEQTVDVQELRRYSAHGRVFAYRVNAGHVSISGRTRIALGAAEVLMYYDTDGGGLFKLREYGSSVPYGLRVPDWVRVPAGTR